MKILGILAVLVILLGLNPVFAQEKTEMQTVYSVTAEIHRDDTVIIKSVNADRGFITTFPTMESGYFVEVLSYQDRELFRANLGVSFTINLGEAGMVELDSTTVQFRVPYYPEAKRILVYHSSKEILDLDLSEEICNSNQACETGENLHNCADCKSGAKDDYCDGIRDGRCDPDCKASEDEDCAEPSPFLGIDMFTLMAVIAVVLLIVVFLILRKRKPRQAVQQADWQSLRQKYQ